MAWTEQCKVAFQTNANAKLLKYKNRSRKVSAVLRELSDESGIPFKTLKRWYYDKTESIRPKNETDTTSSEPDAPPPPLPTCYRCGENKVFLTTRGKPLSTESKHYGLCNSCRCNQRMIEQIDRQATEYETGLMTVCPHCSKAHYMNPGTKYDRNKGE